MRERCATRARCSHLTCCELKYSLMLTNAEVMTLWYTGDAAITN